MENESSMNQFIVIIGMLGAAILVGSIMTQVLGVVRTSSSGIVVSSVSNETNSWPSSPYSFSLDYDEVVSGTDKVYWKNILKGKVVQVLYKTTSKKITDLCRIYKETAASTGIENAVSGLYIQPVEYGRAYHCEHHLYYGDDAGNNKKITDAYRKIVTAFNAKGAFFSRPYGDAADITFDKTGGYREAVRKVKNIFDPAGVMNPGRLSF